MCRAYAGDDGEAEGDEAGQRPKQQGTHWATDIGQARQGTSEIYAWLRGIHERQLVDFVRQLFVCKRTGIFC